VLSRFRAAAAQPLSGQPIRLLVPFPPGGATDIVARPLAQLLGDTLKTSVIVVNRGGAGGSLAADDEAHSAPDGHTLFMATVGTHAINASLYKHLPYDPVRDFTPIALVATAPVTIVVHPSLPVNDLAGLVALAKSEPGKLDYASGGIGTPGHLTFEMFKAVAGIDVVHVPYKGGGPALVDLIAGHVQIMSEPLQTFMSNIKSGRIHPLAVSSKTRSATVPDVPTIAESGYPGFETTAWWGVFGPAGVPAAMADELAGAIGQVVRSDAFRTNLEILGVTPAFLDRSALAEFQQRELVKWGKAVRDSGATAD
jgi:tripartite-type tricarboxylate transporter receptor subunit TctC